jgi:hypothetical protein
MAGITLAGHRAQRGNASEDGDRISTMIHPAFMAGRSRPDARAVMVALGPANGRRYRPEPTGGLILISLRSR